MGNLILKPPFRGFFLHLWTRTNSKVWWELVWLPGKLHWLVDRNVAVCQICQICVQHSGTNTLSIRLNECTQTQKKLPQASLADSVLAKEITKAIGKFLFSSGVIQNHIQLYTELLWEKKTSLVLQTGHIVSHARNSYAIFLHFDCIPRYYYFQYFHHGGCFDLLETET